MYRLFKNVVAQFIWLALGECLINQATIEILGVNGFQNAQN